MIKSIYRAGRTIILGNVALWKDEFLEAWEPLPVDKKLVWFLFLNHTIALVTLIEYLLLKR